MLFLIPGAEGRQSWIEAKGERDGENRRAKEGKAGMKSCADTSSCQQLLYHLQTADASLFDQVQEVRRPHPRLLQRQRNGDLVVSVSEY